MNISMEIDQGICLALLNSATIFVCTPPPNPAPLNPAPPPLFFFQTYPEGAPCIKR